MPWAGVWDKSLIIDFLSQTPDVGRRRKNSTEAADTCLQSLSGANGANLQPWAKCWSGGHKAGATKRPAHMDSVCVCWSRSFPWGL